MNIPHAEVDSPRLEEPAILSSQHLSGDQLAPGAPLPEGVTALPAQELTERAALLAALADRRWAGAPPSGPAHDRARQLHEHVHAYLIPRLRSLDAPLVVLLLGPTGAGKSTLMNTIAGRRVSRTGVLRPTTREAVLMATPDDAHVLLDEGGSLARLPQGRVHTVVDGARSGLAVVDAPDIDSIDHDNRSLADALVEAADLCIFVTTGTRYADRVPWDVLRRVHERQLPLLVVVNRLPPDEADARIVLVDVERLMRQAGLEGQADAGRLDVVGVPEGLIAQEGESLQRAAVQGVLTRIEELGADREQRQQLAARALAGAVAGLGPLVHAVADDVEHEAIDAEALRRVVQSAYESELQALMGDLRGGVFMREEVLRQWQSFVGADQVTRLFASGIGRVRGAVLAVVRGTPPAPIAAVEEETTSDLVAVATLHASEAARRTAGTWAERPSAANLVAGDPSLWSPSPDFPARLEERLHRWVSAIAQDVQTTGGPKRALARGASVGVNALGIAVMLSVFSHTGGLTGAEVGVAAATGFLNQKLLHALFGEAAMVEMVERARRRLEEELAGALGDERARYEALVPASAELRELAAELRASVDQLAA